jgi:predicted ester cyclase
MVCAELVGRGYQIRRIRTATGMPGYSFQDKTVVYSSPRAMMAGFIELCTHAAKVLDLKISLSPDKFTDKEGNTVMDELLRRRDPFFDMWASMDPRQTKFPYKKYTGVDPSRE